MNREKRKIRTLIVDDEPLARQNLRSLLKNDPEVEIVGACDSGSAALELMKEEMPDLMFMDIQMPEMTGFDLVAELKGYPLPVIVFVTAYDQFALKAFEVHAIDYLLKPFDDARFEKALTQAKLQVANLDAGKLSESIFALIANREPDRAARPESAGYLKRIMIKSASRIVFLNVEEIDWIGADDYYVKLHTGKQGHLLRETMNDLEAQLDPGKFIRVHRSTIVNVNRIKELQPHFNGDYLVVLNDGTELRLSRSRREQVQKLLTSGART